LGELTALFQTPWLNRGLTSKGREGNGWGFGGEKGRGENKKGRKEGNRRKEREEMERDAYRVKAP